MIDIVLILAFAVFIVLLLTLASRPLDGETPARHVHARKVFISQTLRKDR